MFFKTRGRKLKKILKYAGTPIIAVAIMLGGCRNEQQPPIQPNSARNGDVATSVATSEASNLADDLNQLAGFDDKDPCAKCFRAKGENVYIKLNGRDFQVRIEEYEISSLSVSTGSRGITGRIIVLMLPKSHYEIPYTIEELRQRVLGKECGCPEQTKPISQVK